MKQESKIPTMKLIATEFNYDFYVGVNSKGKKYYNVVPMGQPTPNGGYFNSGFICTLKNVPNLFS